MKTLIENFNNTTEGLNTVCKIAVVFILTLIISGCLTLAYNLFIGNIPNQFLY